MDTLNSLPDDGVTISGLAAGQTLFGRFVLGRVLGRGGMGVVWLAQDTGLDRPVALKFLPEMLAADPAALDELKRETRRALTLTHPHIVRIHDFHSEGLLAAISMELVDGATLAALRHDRPERVLDLAEVAAIAMQLCEALDYAHTRARVVHRDLKPANLMVTVAGALKVTDFGIAATLADTTTRLSRVAGTVGTPVYMSPQQLMGEPPMATDDIYSLGATLYELLTGKPPFHSGDIVAQVRGRVPARVGERRAELGVGRSGWPAVVDGVRAAAIPVEWDETIAACLAKDPAARPQSAAEVAARLRLDGRAGHASGLGALPPPLPSAPAASAAGRRPRGGGWRWWAGASGLLALLGGAWLLGSHQLAERRAGTVAARPRAGEPWKVPGLGMKFVPVPGTDVLFSVWETRVQNFRVCANETGYDATEGVSSFRAGVWGLHGDSWRSPGFRQGAKHPVVGLDEDDARFFCVWLTSRERAAGRLGPGQGYRRPTAAEFAAARGPGEFSWGDQWPPPARAGNFADAAAGRGLFAQRPNMELLPGYDDGYDGTAPVGSFAPNRFGIYDLNGNACDIGWGGSFADAGLEAIRAQGTSYGKRDVRVGLRVVCVLNTPEAPRSGN